MAKEFEKTLNRIIRNQKSKDKSEEPNIYNPAEQAEGYKKRLEGSGLDPEKELDKRGFIKKTLNLTEDQNPLFDFFEVLNRPQQALFGGINAIQTGDELGKGMLEGISGNKKTKFKDILHEAGMEETEGKLGLDDVLGFAGDIALDPMHWSLIPIKTASTTAKLGTEFVKTAEAVSAVEAAAGGVNTVKTTMTSMSSLVFKGVGTGFKKTLSLADTGIEQALSLISKDAMKAAAKMGQEYTNVSALTKYRGIKDMMQKTFDYTKGLKDGLFRKVQNIRGSGRIAKKRLDILLNTKFNETFKQQVTDFLTANPQYNEKEVYNYLTTIFENGSDTFDFAGKLTIKGQNHNTSLYAILNGDAWLKNTGLDEKTRDKVVQFLENYYPSLAKKYTQNGTWDSLFIEGIDSTGTINNVYRIASDKIHDEIKNKISKLDPNNPDSFISSAPKMLSKEEAIAKMELEEEVDFLRRSLDKGNKRALSRDDAINNEAFYNLTRQSEDHAETIHQLTRPGRPSKEFASLTREERGLRLLKAQKEQAKILKKMDKMMKEHGEDINVLLNNSQEALNAYADYTDITQKQILDILNEEFTVNAYLTNAQKTKIEEFGQLEGVPEMLSTVGSFMQKTSETLVDVMDSAWTLTDGYFPHTVTDEWLELNIKKWEDITEASLTSTRKLRGNPNAFATRKYKLSTIESNATAKSYIDYLLQTKGSSMSEDVVAKLKEGKLTDMFSTDIRTSLADFVKRGVQSTEDAKVLEVVLASDVFDIEKPIDDAPRAFKDAFKKREPRNNFVRVLKKGEAKPLGFSKVNTAALQEKLKKMASYGKNEELYEKAMNMTDLFKNDQLYIDNNIAMMIGRVTEEKGVNDLVDMMDGINNIFKKNKLFSPGFQVRNMFGNFSNLWLSGMPAKDIFKYWRSSHKEMKAGESLFRSLSLGEKTLETLTVSEQATYKAYEVFIKEGFGQLGNALRDIPEELWNINMETNHWKAYKNLKKVDPSLSPSLREMASAPKAFYNEAVALNMHLNQYQDSLFRMSAWRYAKDNPEFLQRMNIDSPEAFTRLSLFDFQDLSVVEQDYMRKIIPFYTFTKKNLAYQMRNIMENGGRYHRLQKGFDSLWGTLDLTEEETDKFKVENFWIPIPYKTEDGKYRAIKASLPLGDLGEFAESPLQRALSSTSPILRAPFEIALNKQMFSGMPIEEFKGQKGFYIPEMGKKAEYALSQTGLDVPATLGFDIGRTVANVAKGEIKNPLLAAEGALGRSVTSIGDAERTVNRKAYNELDDLQNLMRYYKQEGIDIKTLDEIENKGVFSRTKQIMQELRRLTKG